MHKAFVNGVEGGNLFVRKGADDLFGVYFLDQDDVPVNLTGAAITLEVYDTEDRRNAAIKSIAATSPLAAPTSGWTDFPLTPTIMNFGPGRYYAYTKFVLSGATTLSRKFTTFDVE